jgi:anti-anti-sigma factor
MELRISKVGDVVTILLEGRIDANVAPDIEQKLLSLISEGSCKLVADLSEVMFISSAGLRALIAVFKEAKKEKGDLQLAGVKGHVQEVFDITGFSTIFKIYASAEDAVRSFGD